MIRRNGGGGPKELLDFWDNVVVANVLGLTVAVGTEEDVLLLLTPVHTLLGMGELESSEIVVDNSSGGSGIEVTTLEDTVAIGLGAGDRDIA